ncbi:MAG: 30S ribosomal protein S12 methylthiotransferase RimO [Defluviitaleaceae bacterium]|nr:30S ribosomal protein S12 methylthiotransferase RimO [Defluviitaleaceae bacterium]
MPNIYLVSLGCDKNRVDGETMIGTLRNAGYTVIQDPAQAQAIIVNTCGFIKDAVQESIDLILELSEYKTAGDCEALLVVGCMAQRYRKEIEEAIPEADLIIGVGEYENIAHALENLIGPPDVPQNLETATLSRIAARIDDMTPHIAYVKIAEGCDNCCTYCTIPSIRGPYRSRPMADILEESRQLVAAGARELVLVAQDTSLYGTDIYGEKRLPELLRELAQTSGATWIRLMYVYPEHITDELIDTMAALPQVCHYIDMPIQHSEDPIIKLMGRGGSKAGLVVLIKKLRAKMPDIAIRTTLIVSFPGETTRDFEDMEKFVQAMQFDRLGVFPYSREDGTPAAKLPHQVRESTKLARLERLMDAQQKIHFAKQAGHVGRVLQVMVDSREETGEYIGRTQWDAYEVDSVVVFTADEVLAPGEVYPVRITQSDGYDLQGELTT